MRLTPIESPRRPLVRLLYWSMRRQFGKAIMPFKVIFARLPSAIPSQLGIYWGLGRGLPIDGELELLLKTHTSSLNGCAFCVDIGRAMATYRGNTLEKVDAIAEWRTNPLFSEAERAALAYVDAMIAGPEVPDDVFNAVRKHYSEREVVELTVLVATYIMHNRVFSALKVDLEPKKS